MTDYFYFIDKYFGLCYLRVPTWSPFRLQCFDLFNEEYNCQMIEVRGQRTEMFEVGIRNGECGRKIVEGEMSSGERCAWCIERRVDDRV